MKQLILLICLPVSVFCQNTIGLPDVINYSKKDYSGGLQNWDFTQDKNGILYVANNEGLLSFDGRNWNLYPLPNKTIVRSVAIGLDNRIYVGGQDELGYFAPAQNGVLQYHSLTTLIPAKDNPFGDVWDIISFNKSVFFRSTGKIFKLTNNAIEAYYAPSEWTYLGICNGLLYGHDIKTGLLKFENNIWTPLGLKSDMPDNDLVTGIISLKKDSALITTLKHGLYILSNTGISAIVSSNNQLFETERIYAARAVNADWIILATNNSGIYIIDWKGNIIQRFSKTEKIQNNNVLSIFLDNQRNVWLGLDNGIDLISYNSAIKQINPASQDGSGYSAIIFDNQLFAGTTTGLYSVALKQVKDLSFSKGDFTLVNNTKGQNWGLAEINNQLMLGHHEGAFEIKGKVSQLISSSPGFWNFIPMSGISPSTQMVAGNYKGLAIFDFINGRFVQSKQIPGFTESSRFIALDNEDNIWVSHPYHGVFKISKLGDGSFLTHAYTEKNGLPSILNNHVFKIKNKVVVATEKGIYTYNENADNFEISPYYQKIIGEQSIRYLKEDQSGNIWFIHEKTPGVIDLSGKEPAIIYLPELNNKMLSGFEFIYPVNESNIFFGAEKGFFHLNYEKYKKTLPSLGLRIRTVRIIGKLDSLLFGGYSSGLNEKQNQGNDKIPKIGPGWKTIQFEYSSILFGYESNLEYAYRLKGFDDNWSAWTKRTVKEYTHFPAGEYTFEVKVRNNLGNESVAAIYSFVVLPPWFLTITAKILYFIIFIAVVYFLNRWQKKKLIHQKEKYENEQKRLSYIHELERSKSESEIIALRNEKLGDEINFKNSEVASSAMHLVKKGELLSKIKAEITQVMKGIDNPEAAAGLKKMLKTLSEDDNMDKEWENFSKHFDKVHGDFVAGLKEKHPAITGNELKLCAYLRMNLSTKEIAQLMNISVRGVEISRYRLRKKLGISSEVNLFDYLLKLQTKG